MFPVMDYTTIVDAATLAQHLNDPQWVICDCRHDLANYSAGYQAYRAGHIPGARFLHLDVDLSGPKTGINGRHPLPHPATFCLRMGALGISNRHQIIAYDDVGGPYASRLWWMLRWVGHTRVAVLDGGWQSWTGGGHPVTVEQPAVVPAAFTGHPQAALAVSADTVAQSAAQGQLVIDGRSADRFRGENETLDPVAGHIPGAINRFFKNNLADDGRFKAADTLRGEFSAAIDGRTPESIIHQCGSGVTACHNLLAMEIAGLGGSRLYPGSWSEWVSDRSRPVATGNG